MGPKSAEPAQPSATGRDILHAGSQCFPFQAPDELFPLLGSFLPFASTALARRTTGDPRLSIAERYESKEAYLSKVRAVANDLVAARYLLAADVPGIVEHASAHWERRSH